MSILEATQISKSYSKSQMVLKDLNYTIEKGEIHVIFGRSGSGKTTFLNCISGILHLDSGSISILNTDISKLNENQRADFRLKNLGILYQFFNLLPALSIEENICLGARLLKKDHTEHLKDLSYRFGIQNILNKYPSQCSGGERQRAALIRALITEPSLLIADEPTGNLDSENRDIILKHLATVVKERNIGLIIATHDHAFTSIANTTWQLQNQRLERGH